jgi:two-component system, chemotaxis family, response regulator Rcp1
VLDSSKANRDEEGCLPKQIDILLIENDPGAALITKEALKEAGLLRHVQQFRDGDAALDYLRGQGSFSERTLPDVIFLDLHLPRKSGLEVLTELKSRPGLAAVPVVIISGSSNPVEVREAYELHASCYIRKPDDLDQFLHFMRICFEFWGTVATLPVAATR